MAFKEESEKGLENRAAMVKKRMRESVLEVLERGWRKAVMVKKNDNILDLEVSSSAYEGVVFVFSTGKSRLRL
ncbi:hypothetical protein L2E82_31674 [Cichorium intybus]|uniref:Uncharacterized protein n=1 Tax=Cichorium intybus TaxID=13427 RepID=A0ACB9BFF8_CICIN|nr:hypothetical protein L2E82_31674 [Cichorium intybus]